MERNEAMIHIDFAENYILKSANTIQSAHFRASHNQTTLHTGVAYFGGVVKAESFCTVANSLEHGPVAVWAYLEPVLDDIYVSENLR